MPKPYSAAQSHSILALAQLHLAWVFGDAYLAALLWSKFLLNCWTCASHPNANVQ